MGREARHEGPRTGGAPLRCPFCHAEVDRAREEWLACERCLAAHHAACWHEGGACAGCGETRSVRGAVTVLGGPAREEPRALTSAPAVALELDLRGRNGHFEGEKALVLLAHPGSPETWELRVRNETEKAREVKVRELPAWLRVVGSGTLEVRMAELETTGKTIQAVVTKLTPNNHNQMYYVYEVDGVRYERNDFARGQRVGDPVTITYLPRDPSISVPGTDITKAGAPGIAMIPFVLLLGAFAGFAISGATLGMPRAPRR